MKSLLNAGLKQAVKRSPVYPLVRELAGWYSLQNWERNGRSGPPPHQIKRRTVKEYAAKFGLRTLIETGTYQGDMVAFARRHFDRVYSIEVDPDLSRAAQKRFRSDPRIQIVQGDSEQVLPKVLDSVSDRALFWLDAHYSGGITGKGLHETPIVSELEIIFRHRITDHVILIDDARCFVGQNDYPALREFERFILTRRPGWTFEVNWDIIRVTPPAVRDGCST